MSEREMSESERAVRQARIDLLKFGIKISELQAGHETFCRLFNDGFALQLNYSRLAEADKDPEMTYCGIKIIRVEPTA